MAARKNDTDAGRKDGQRGRLPLIVVLCVSAALVAGLGIHELRRGQGRREETALKTDRDKDLGAVLRAKIENALADVDETGEGPGLDRLRREVLVAWRDNAAKYVRTDPADVRVRPMLARLLLRLDQVQDAAGVVEDVLRLAPGSAEGLYLKGLVNRRLGKESMDFFRRAAEDPHADAEMWMTYGRALMREGRFEPAEIYLGKAIQARRQTAGKLSAADAGALSDLGAIAIQAGRFDVAAERLAEAAALAPENLEIAMKLVEAQRLAGRLDAAEASVAEAKKRFGKWADQAALSMELGRIRKDRQQWLAAAEAFEQATRHRDLGIDAAFEAAVCYYRAQEYALAMRHIDTVVEARPLDAAALAWRRKIEDARFPRP